VKNYNDCFEKIELLRKELIQIAFQEGLTNEKTIKLSEKLDNYIVKYQIINHFYSKFHAADVMR
jgi:hypothetical protein